MIVFLSKLLPIFLYPLGLACVLLVAVLLSKRSPRWQRIGVILALVLLWLGGNHWVASGLARSLEWRYLPMENLPKSEVIVVLGGGTQPKSQPRPIVEINGAGDRLFYAASLYHQEFADHLLLSGGKIPWYSNGTSTEASPAEEMAVLLEMLGVPPTAIWLEPDSLNTYENAVNSQRILHEKGIESIILVTSAIHMPRSVKLFEAQGLNVTPAPVDYYVTQEDWTGSLPQQIMRIFPSAGNLALTTRALKEYFGILFYNLRGWT
jgi:uncharacterized SAM-binding protein YcdF (DUF218 family)